MDKRYSFRRILALLLCTVFLVVLFLPGCGITAAATNPALVADSKGSENTGSGNLESNPEVEAQAEALETTDVGEDAAETAFPKELMMFYDDRMNLAGKDVEILDAGTPDSYQVGYGVEEGTPDEAVIRFDGDALIAVGTGSAEIKVDGEACSVIVTAAPISLFLLMGQSNMEGMEGEPEQSIVCPDGWVYASFGDHLVMNRYTASYFAPSALTGEYRDVNVNGTMEYLSDFPVYSLTEEGDGKKGPDSGIAYEWVKATGEKVWVVNAAHSGAKIKTFEPYCVNWLEATSLFKACQKTLKNEIAAGHYTLSHMGMFWCQGESDAGYTADWYVEMFKKMWTDLKKTFSIDMDSDPATPDNTLEFANLILPLAGGEQKGYRKGTYQNMTEGFYSTFLELEMRGHRVGQIWMGANPELADINVVCNLGDTWMTMPDGRDGVEEYFTRHYEDGRVDYSTQEPQPEEWYTPKTAWEVKDSIHYNQIGYNEVGIEAARNTCILLGYLEDTDEETMVRLVNWTGYEEASTVLPSVYGTSDTLVVPVVSPIYRAKTITFEVTEGLKYQYYDLLTANNNIKEGMLSVAGIDEVNIIVAIPGK